MKELTEKDHFDYAWKHFTVIADQRLKTFNFYIVLVAAGVAATLAAIDKQKSFWVLISCGVFHIMCATVFFLIDERSKRLVNTPKQVLIEFEKNCNWRLFLQDTESQNKFWHKVSSYGFAFRLAFCTQFIFGCFAIIMAWVNR